MVFYSIMNKIKNTLNTELTVKNRNPLLIITPTSTCKSSIAKYPTLQLGTTFQNTICIYEHLY